MLFAKILCNTCFALFCLCQWLLMKFHQFMKFFQGKNLSSILYRCRWSTSDAHILHRKYQVKPHSSPWFSAACATTIVHRNHFSFLYQTDKSSDSKAKFRHTSNHCKRVLEAAKLVYANKTKESITSHKLGSQTFSKLLIVYSIKVNLPPLFNIPEVLSSASVKAKLFAENFSKKSNLDDSGISLLVFPSRTNLKLHNM